MEGLKESSPDFIDGEDFEHRLDYYREAYEPVEVRAYSFSCVGFALGPCCFLFIREEPYCRIVVMYICMYVSR